jgi:vitamin B12 transporter
VAQLGSPGAVASLFLRGGESDYVQVLVDGVQVNDPGGSYDWAHLTTADVERIEIVRGPASVLYGSDAISGVVQVFTRGGGSGPRIGADAAGASGPSIGADADGGSRTRIEADAGAGSAERVGEQATGSFRTWHASAAVSGGGDVAWGTAGYAFTVARQHSDGAYAFNNQYGNTTLAGRLTLERGSGTRLAASARYGRAIANGRRRQCGRSQPRDLRRSLAAAQRCGSAGVVAHGPSALRLFAATRDDPEGIPGVSRSTSGVESWAGGWRPTPALALSAGLELERQHGRSTFDSDGPFGPYSSASDDERSNRAVFAQLVHAGPSLGLTAGGRLDRSTQFGSFATARVGVSWQLARALRIHTAWGSGFKEPTFLETYATGFARGNPSLEPERARSVELGVRADGGRAHVAVTAFRQSFRNLIQYTFAPPDEAAPNYFNMGAARAFGLELEAGASLPHGLHASAGYTGLDTEVIDAGLKDAGSGRQVAAAPPGWQRHRGVVARRVSTSLRAERTGAAPTGSRTRVRGRRVGWRLTRGRSLTSYQPLRRVVPKPLQLQNLLDGAISGSTTSAGHDELSVRVVQ